MFIDCREHVGEQGTDYLTDSAVQKKQLQQYRTNTTQQESKTAKLMEEQAEWEPYDTFENLFMNRGDYVFLEAGEDRIFVRIFLRLEEREYYSYLGTGRVANSDEDAFPTSEEMDGCKFEKVGQLTLV